MKTNALESDWLAHYFTNVAIANVGDAGGLPASVAAGSLYLSLHTAYPGEAGSQATSEATYTGYARKAVARSVAEWTVTGNSVTTDNANAFPACTGGANDVYFVGVGRSASGAGTLDYVAPLGTELGEGTAVAATDTITVPGLTGVAVNDEVAFFVLPKGALPSGITAGTIYFVKTVSGNDLTISATLGGATLDLTAAGAVLAYKMIKLAISNGITPSVAAGALTVREE